MDASTRATGSFQYRIRFAALIIVFVIAGSVFILIGQFAALVLLPLVVLLVAAIDRRDRRAQSLAARITDDRQFDKLEVPHGPWGDLARAVNGLLQERRVEQRLRAALPSPLPLEAVQSLLGGDLAAGGQSRPVAVLLVGAPVRAPAWEHGLRRGGLAAWQALALTAQQAAQQHGALLQPCGDAVMLVFGAFEDRPARESLRQALAAAALLQRSWRDSAETGALALALSTGHALAAALPGMGFCVVGVRDALFDPAVAGDVLASGFGLVWAQRIGVALLLWVIVGVVHDGTTRALWAVPALGLALAIVDSTASAAPTALAIAAVTLHEAAMGAWIGGLALLLALWNGLGREQRATVLAHFGRLSGIAIAVLIVSGLVLASLHLAQPAKLFTSFYGATLTIKLLVALIAIGLAAFGRRMYGQIWRGRAALAALIVVVGVAGLLVSLPSP